MNHNTIHTIRKYRSTLNIEWGLISLNKNEKTSTQEAQF